MSEMGSHDPFGHLKHKLWPKERSGVKLEFDSRPLKVKNHPDFFACKQRVTYRWKSLTRVTTLLQSSSWLVCRQIYGPPNSWKSQLREFWDSHLGVPRQNAIWMLVPWPTIEYIKKGKMVASPKFGPWWILWAWVCSWLVLAPKVF